MCWLMDPMDVERAPCFKFLAYWEKVCTVCTVSCMYFATHVRMLSAKIITKSTCATPSSLLLRCHVPTPPSSSLSYSLVWGMNGKATKEQAVVHSLLFK